MLSNSNVQDIKKMKNYYRASDMLDLLEFFPELSVVRDLTIIEDEADYKKNAKYIKTLENCRMDSPKGSPAIEGKINGRNGEFLSDLVRAKEKDPNGVLLLFNIDAPKELRHEHWAGICVRVDVGEDVVIEAVGKGFDGSEVSKGICAHERYYIPWFDLRGCSFENFKSFQIFQIEDAEYRKTRDTRIKFLESIGLGRDTTSDFIPTEYVPIPDFIWHHIVKTILKKLQGMEEILIYHGFKHFAIHGHTRGNKFCPWQMFDKSRYSVS